MLMTYHNSHVKNVDWVYQTNLSISNRLQPQNPLQPAPSPMGEGWGEGILRISAIFPNTLTTPIQALRLVALSLALSHGREDGVAVGIKQAVACM